MSIHGPRNNNRKRVIQNEDHQSFYKALNEKQKEIWKKLLCMQYGLDLFTMRFMPDELIEHAVNKVKHQLDV